MKSGVNPFGHPVLAGVSSDGGSIYVTDVEEDTDPLYRIDVKNRTWAPAGEAYAGGSLITEPATNIAIGYVVNGEDQPIYTFFDPTDQAIWQRVLKAFKGAHVELESMSADRTKILVSVFGNEWGNSYLLIDRKSMKADYYADVYDGIGPDELSKRTLIHYKAADGFDIPAYLTLPKSKPAKGLPLIVLPHGGPFARDMSGFDWWSQAYASRGYAVLQPQFRGSAGFGTAHLAMITSGMAVIGTPDDAIAQIERLQQQSGGFGAFLQLAHNWADFEQTKRSYELMARYVFPRFQDLNRNREASLDWARTNREVFMGEAMMAVGTRLAQHIQEKGSENISPEILANMAAAAAAKPAAE